MKTKTLLNRLIQAQYCCSLCGEKYGKQRTLLSTWHEAKCDVCKRKTGITETRDFGYLKEGRKVLQEQVKAEEKKVKARIKRNSRKIGPVWTEVSKAMQDYYRATGLLCCVCLDRQEVMHHWQHWGTSIALRLEPKNLVPLCKSCHYSWHNRQDIKMERKITEYMNCVHSTDDFIGDLIELEKKHVKKTEAEWRDYLYVKIAEFKELLKKLEDNQ